jgi:hypothetical protein
MKTEVRGMSSHLRFIVEPQQTQQAAALLRLYALIQSRSGRD